MTAPGNMVEAVKEAICNAGKSEDGLNPYLSNSRTLGYFLSVGIDATYHDHQKCEALLELAARAAITAMMEPSEGMVAAAAGAGRSQDFNFGAEYRAALQAALEEGRDG